MEKSTVVTLLIVVGLVGVAWWLFGRQTPTSAAIQIPHDECSGSSGVYAADSAISGAYGVKISPQQFCSLSNSILHSKYNISAIGSKAISKGVRGVESFFGKDAPTLTFSDVNKGTGTGWSTLTINGKRP